MRGDGLDELLRRMREQIVALQIPVITTSSIFDEIRNCVLELKEHSQSSRVLTDNTTLQRRIPSSTGDDVRVVAGHLAKYGYVHLCGHLTGTRLLCERRSC
jgi:hypothetical protein